MKSEPMRIELDVGPSTTGELRGKDRDPILSGAAHDKFYYQVRPTYIVHGSATFDEKKGPEPTSLLCFEIEADGEFDKVIRHLKVTMTFSSLHPDAVIDGGGDDEANKDATAAADKPPPTLKDRLTSLIRKDKSKKPTPLRVFKMTPDAIGYKFDAQRGDLTNKESSKNTYSVEAKKEGVGGKASHEDAKGRDVIIHDAEFYGWARGNSRPSRTRQKTVDTAVWTVLGEVETKSGVPPRLSVAVVLQRPEGPRPWILCEVTLQNHFKFITIAERLRGNRNSGIHVFHAGEDENDFMGSDPYYGLSTTLKGLVNGLEKCTEEPLMTKLMQIQIPRYYLKAIKEDTGDSDDEEEAAARLAGRAGDAKKSGEEGEGEEGGGGGGEGNDGAGAADTGKGDGDEGGNAGGGGVGADEEPGARGNGDDEQDERSDASDEEWYSADSEVDW